VIHCQQKRKRGRGPIVVIAGRVCSRLGWNRHLSPKGKLMGAGVEHNIIRQQDGMTFQVPLLLVTSLFKSFPRRSDTFVLARESHRLHVVPKHDVNYHILFRESCRPSQFLCDRGSVYSCFAALDFQMSFRSRSLQRV